MKTKFTLIFIFINGIVNSQSPWTQKANFGGLGRSAGVSFSIGNSGYIGTGTDFNSYFQDFWQWDQSTNTWTQKSNFGGGARGFSVGFSIGTKGYIGTGINSALSPDKVFWEWDQGSNSWTQKATFPGTARSSAIGFSIGTKGYIGSGEDATNNNLKDFWEWDQPTNTWIQKADFGGSFTSSAVGFSIGSKGYIATGNGVSASDLWEWDSPTNAWTQKADFVNLERYGATGFSIGTKGYIGLGIGGNNLFRKDFWEWDQATNTWKQKTDYAGGSRNVATGFSIGGKGYIGTGVDSTLFNLKQDFWEYDPSWDCAGNSSFTANSYSVSVGNTVTFSNTSTSSTSYNWLNNGVPFSTSTNSSYTYTTIGTYTVSLVASNGNCSNTSKKIITAKCIISNFSTSASTISPGNTVTFTNTSSGSTSYTWLNNGIAFSNSTNATFTYNSVGTYVVKLIATNGSCSDTTTKTVIVQCPVITSSFLASNDEVIQDDTVYFTNNSALATSYQWMNGAIPFSSQTNSSYIFDTPGTFTISLVASDGPCNNISSVIIVVKPCGVWNRKADFTGNGQQDAIAFSIGNKGFVGSGGTSTAIAPDNFYEWEQYTQSGQTLNSWKTYYHQLPELQRRGAAGFSIGNKGYFGMGRYGTAFYLDFWEYDPSSNSWTQKANFVGPTREYGVSFSIGTKGYFGTGRGYDILLNSIFYSDFWEYDPTLNVWTQKANFGGGNRYEAVGFAIGNRGYVGVGRDKFNVLYKDFWEFDPSANTWIQKSNFAGTARNVAVGFSIDTLGFIGTGMDLDSVRRDFWQWNQNTNVWTQVAYFGGAARWGAVSFTIGRKGYVTLGQSPSGFIYPVDLWEYRPCVPGLTTQNAEISGQKEEIKIYPNPSFGQVYISHPVNACEISVTDILGHPVYTEKTLPRSSSFIDLSSAPSGIYFLKVRTENGVVTKKIIKN